MQWKNSFLNPTKRQFPWPNWIRFMWIIERCRIPISGLRFNSIGIHLQMRIMHRITMPSEGEGRGAWRWSAPMPFNDVALSRYCWQLLFKGISPFLRRRVQWEGFPPKSLYTCTSMILIQWAVLLFKHILRETRHWRSFSKINGSEINAIGPRNRLCTRVLKQPEPFLTVSTYEWNSRSHSSKGPFI